MKKLIILLVVIGLGAAAYAAMQPAEAPASETNDEAMDAMENGDAMEATDSDDETAEDSRMATAEAELVGSWSSAEDRNFERDYRADGTVADRYASAEGETVTQGTWSLFTADTAEADVDFQMNNSDVYVRQTDSDGSVHFFRIASAGESELELVDMSGNGSVMLFGKLTTGQEMRDGQE